MAFSPPGPALLFCPGNRPERFDKAAERSDVVLLDLEDAVGPQDKEFARAAVLKALPRFGDRAVVRVNAVGTPWYAADVRAVVAAGARTVMLPKVSSPEDVRGLAELQVIALCETAAGVVRAADIAVETNCAALFWGGEDLVADLGGRSSRDLEGRYYSVIEQARSTVLLAAAAAGRPAIDAVNLDVDDLDALTAEANQAAAVGFLAKACIHPKHVDIIRAAFAATPTQLAWADGVLTAAERSGGGVFTYQGRMIDAPLYAHARAIVARTTNTERQR